MLQFDDRTAKHLLLDGSRISISFGKEEGETVVQVERINSINNRGN